MDRDDDIRIIYDIIKQRTKFKEFYKPNHYNGRSTTQVLKIHVIQARFSQQILLLNIS